MGCAFEAGDAYGIKPVGLGARDTLRLEMGFCLTETTLMTAPPSAGGIGLDHPLHPGEIVHWP